MSVFYDGKEEKGMRGSSFKQCMASWRVYNGRHFKAVGDRSQAWPVLKNSSKNRQKSEKSRVFLGADFSTGKKHDF